MEHIFSIISQAISFIADICTIVALFMLVTNKISINVNSNSSINSDSSKKQKALGLGNKQTMS